MKFANRLSALFTCIALTIIMVSCGGADNKTSGLSAEQEKSLKALQTEVSLVNKQLPMDAGAGLTLEKMEITDEYLVSTVSYPEDLEFEVDDTPETKAEIIKAVPASAIKRLKELNLGIKYIYVQNGSGQSDDITIPASEL